MCMHLWRGCSLTNQNFKMADRGQQMKPSKSTGHCLWCAQSKKWQVTSSHALTEVSKPLSLTRFTPLREEFINYMIPSQKAHELTFEFGTFDSVWVFNKAFCAFSRDLQIVMATWARPKASTTTIGIHLLHLPLGRPPLVTPHDPAYYGMAYPSTGMSREDPSSLRLVGVTLWWDGKDL